MPPTVTPESSKFVPDSTNQGSALRSKNIFLMYPFTAQHYMPCISIKHVARDLFKLRAANTSALRL